MASRKVSETSPRSYSILRWALSPVLSQLPARALLRHGCLALLWKYPICPLDLGLYFRIGSPAAQGQASMLGMRYRAGPQSEHPVLLLGS